MRVEDALQLPSLAGARVVSGARGIDREIMSVMILEATDIENWGTEGMLLLTSYFALADLDDAAVRAFFSKLERIKISGIIFKTDRLVAAVPDLMIELSNELGIPIIQVSKDARYEPIVSDILGTIINANITLLNRFYTSHRQMMTLALTQPSVPDILFEVKNSLKIDATYYNANTKSRTSTSTALANFTQLEMSPFEIHRGSYLSFHYFNATPIYADGRIDAALSVEIPSSDSVKYYLILHRDPDSFSHLDLMTVENFVSLLEMEILKLNALDRQSYIKNNSIAHDLLLDRYATTEAVDKALEELSIARFSRYQAILVRVIPGRHISGDRSMLEDIITVIRRSIRKRCGASAFYESNDRFVILNNIPDSGEPLGVSDVVEAIEEAKRSTYPDFTYLAAISHADGRYHIGALNREVMDVHRLFGDQISGDRCIRYEDLGVLRLLLDLPEGADVGRFLDPRLLRLRSERPELFETVVEYYRSGTNYQETAARLFLHPKTVQYRVHLAEDLAGIDVTNPDDLMQIAFAGKVLEIMGEGPVPVRVEE